MKTMKVALLATAALAAVSVSARADDTAAIKAQLEALNARIAQLEAGPALPTGYSLLTVSEADATVVPGLEVLNKDAATYGKKATVIGILPTADAPAATTIEWSGYVRAAIAYTNYNAFSSSEDDSSGGIYGRGELKVVGKTDTAVGEVGVKMRLRGNFETTNTNNDVRMKEAWGWWAMTPELTLGGGYTGSLGNIGYGLDGACNCYWTDNSDAADFDPNDTSQMRLTYASGPFSAAVAVEDSYGNGSFNTSYDHGLGVAAEVKYSGDSVSGEISGVWRNAGDASSYSDPWQVGAGLGFALGDMANLSLAAAVGSNYYGDDYYGVSGLISANLSDSVHGEIAGAYKTYNADNNNDYDQWTALAGIYYEPVSQLTLGIEAEYIATDYSNGPNSNADVTTVDFVSVFRF